MLTPFRNHWAPKLEGPGTLAINIYQMRANIPDMDPMRNHKSAVLKKKIEWFVTFPTLGPWILFSREVFERVTFKQTMKIQCRSNEKIRSFKSGHQGLGYGDVGIVFRLLPSHHIKIYTVYLGDYRNVVTVGKRSSPPKDKLLCQKSASIATVFGIVWVGHNV